eukprot:m.303614 g.303614  ORF g.303614 m.303614 type:complete len:479 (+) comp40836_c0_seq2:2784-4220(+)
MYLADTLSRAYLDTPTEMAPWQTETCMQLEEIDLEEDSSLESDKLTAIRQGTGQDPELQSVTEILQRGWPTTKAAVPQLAKPYYTMRDEMYLQNGLVCKGDRVVIPTTLRADMMAMLHSTHLGIEGCLRRARESFFWPGMNAQIRDYISVCSICNSIRPEQCREPLMSSEVPKRPWSKVAVDLFSLESVDYLITVDYYSNFFEVDRLANTIAPTVIHKLKSHFARHGIPDIVVSDNGPQFANEEFTRFSREWGFKHVTSSPRYPQSNGKVENSVNTCKTIMKKALKAQSDVYLALMDFRNTPSEKIGPSPAQLLFGRQIQTRLPVTPKLLQPAVAAPEVVTRRISEAKEQQAARYDQKSKPLPPLKPGDTVRMKRPGQKEWSPAVCKKRLDSRSYMIKSGPRMYRRNRRQIRKTNEQFREEEPQFEMDPPEEEVQPEAPQREKPPDPPEDTDSTTDHPTQPREASTPHQVTRSGRLAS